MKFINQVKSLLPLWTVVIITLGYVRLYYWYKWFNIDITTYLEFSEIILLSIKYLIVGFFILILVVFVALLAKHHLKKYFSKRVKNRFKANSKKNFIKRLFQRFKNDWAFFLVVIFSILLHKILDYNDPFTDLFYNSWRVHFISFRASQILPIIFLSNIFFDELLFLLKKSEFKIKSIIQYKYLLLLLICSIISIKIISEHQSYKKMFIGNQIVNVKTSQVDISTGKEHRYLGETRNYIFIYNCAEQTTLTINKSNITYLSYGFDQGHF